MKVPGVLSLQEVREGARWRQGTTEPERRPEQWLKDCRLTRILWTRVRVLKPTLQEERPSTGLLSRSGNCSDLVQFPSGNRNADGPKK